MRYGGAAVLLAAAVVIGAADLNAQAVSTTLPACAAQPIDDQDADGLADECEVALAQAFAPTLVVRSGGCNWDATSSTPRHGGGYLFAVQPIGDASRIAYLPAYFRDCGWRGIKCWLPWVNCAGHDGDSEIIIVDVRRDSAAVTWRVSGVFLSAHCFGRSPSSCRWYRGSDLDAFAWAGAAPVVWVAEGRNANYPSWQACDRGHRTIDTCDRHDAYYAFPIDAARNIGSVARPAFEHGCLRGSELGSSLADAAVTECFWNVDVPFRGWQRGVRGVTPYARYLFEIAGF